MKAIFYDTYGSPGVLQVREVEKPSPKEKEVLIKVHAASINSWDWDLLTGKPRIYRLFFGLFKPKIKILGADVAGRIEAIGKDVKQLRKGDEVFGDLSGGNWGCFAEYVCADESALAIKPHSMSFEQAAAIPQAGILALQGLSSNKRKIKAGQTVLINGAGGGVGTFAIQIAKSYGAEVTGVDHATKFETMRLAGADHVIDYMLADYTKNGKQYDMILDVLATRSVFDYKRTLSKDGTFVMVGGRVASILQTAFLGSLFSRFGNKKMELLMHKPNRQDLEHMKTLFESDKVAPVIDKVFTLEETAEAFRYFGSGNVKGKVVVQCQD